MHQLLELHIMHYDTVTVFLIHYFAFPCPLSLVKQKWFKYDFFNEYSGGMNKGMTLLMDFKTTPILNPEIAN